MNVDYNQPIWKEKNDPLGPFNLFLFSIFNPFGHYWTILDNFENVGSLLTRLADFESFGTIS